MRGGPGDSDAVLPEADSAFEFDGTSLDGWREIPGGDPITAPSDAVMVMAVLDWGWWSKTVDGTRNAHPAGVEGVLQAWCSRETVKHLSAWTSGADRPAGRDLELTPQANPFARRTGDKLTVVVTLDGVRVSLEANIGRPAEAAHAAAHRLDGVGLFRTEFMFLDAPSPPAMAHQCAIYREAARPLAGGTDLLVQLRTGRIAPTRIVDL